MLNASWYFIIGLFNLFDAVHISIFEFEIMLYWDKLYQYIGLASVISIVIDPNITKNAIFFCYDSGVAFDCLSKFLVLCLKSIWMAFQKNKSSMSSQAYSWNALIAILQ